MRRLYSPERSHSHGRLTIHVTQGDIVREKVDVIVNAANGSLMHGGGVAGAVSCAGGRRLDDESRDWVRQHGRVPDGEVAYTSGGAMKHLKYVIHAVGPIYRGGRHREEEKLYNAVFNSLVKATELKCKSISIPAISSGIFGYPKEECAVVFFRAIKDYIRQFGDKNLELIRLCNFDYPTVSVFVKEFDRTRWDLDQPPSPQEEEKKDSPTHIHPEHINISSGDNASDSEKPSSLDPIDISMKSIGQSNIDISMKSNNYSEPQVTYQTDSLLNDITLTDSITIDRASESGQEYNPDFQATEVQEESYHGDTGSYHSPTDSADAGGASDD